MEIVAVHLAEGFEEIEAIAIIDVLRRADFEVKIVSISNQLMVTGAHNITLKADVLFQELDYKSIKMIVLPGGMPGSKNLNAHDGLKQQIVRFYKENKFLAAICAAPLVFGNLGILEGRKVSCYPGFEAEMDGAILTGEEIEQSGNIITGRGAGVAIKFALKIVEIFKGKSFADNLAQMMIVK